MYQKHITFDAENVLRHQRSKDQQSSADCRVSISQVNSEFNEVFMIQKKSSLAKFGVIS